MATAFNTNLCLFKSMHSGTNLPKPGYFGVLLLLVLSDKFAKAIVIWFIPGFECLPRHFCYSDKPTPKLHIGIHCEARSNYCYATRCTLMADRNLI